MGDRAVIGFKATDSSTTIWLYLHWGGSDRYGDVVRGLTAAKPRWHDANYATRIAVSQIINEDWMEETGFGISCGDDGFPWPDYDDIPIIVWSEQVVEVYHVSDLKQPRYNATFDVVLSVDITSHAVAAVSSQMVAR
jgi:hypothetical protein